MTTTTRTLRVSSRPAAQPRHRTSRFGTYVDKDSPVHLWKAQMVLAWREKYGAIDASGPVALALEFTFARPKKPKHQQHITKPDLDNLAKAVMDSLTTARAWVDDSQVWSLTLTKAYSDDPGVLITMTTEEIE